MMTHTERQRKPCPDCGKEVYEQLMKGHRMLHTGGRKQTCSVCHKTVSNIGSLRVHMKLHHRTTTPESGKVIVDG